MRKFVFTVFTLIFLIVVLMVLCDIIYTKVYTNSIPRNTFQYVLKTKNKKYDFVFLGSSRVKNNINTELFDSLSNKKSINLGVLGSGLDDNLLLIKLLINNNIKISYIYLELDNNFESINHSNMAASDAMPFIRTEIIKEHIEKYIPNFDYLYYIPFYRYAINEPKIGIREFISSLINRSSELNLSKGYMPKYGSNLNEEYSLPKTISEKNESLNDIISLCKSHNIKIILFTAPYSNKVKNIQYIDKLKVIFPELVDLSRMKYKNEYFYDNNHLNDMGAQVFTKDLYNKTINRIK